MPDLRDDPSLLRFVLERLDDEEEQIILNTPLPMEDELSPEIVARLLGRGPLLTRTQLDREAITACLESMQRVQGPPRVATPVDPPHEATVLGSEVIKLVASRFVWHPDYQPHWAPGS